MKRKTGIAAEKIVITPLSESGEDTVVEEPAAEESDDRGFPMFMGRKPLQKR